MPHIILLAHKSILLIIKYYESNRMKKSIVILLLALSIGGAQAQDFLRRIAWDAEFTTRFDNREYRSDFSDSKTYFGYKFMPVAGLYTKSGRNALFTGADMTRDMGMRGISQPDPEFMLWYLYKSEKLTAHVGVFPRKYMSSYPREFFSGTNSFYDGVMEGMLLEYRGWRWNIEFAGDWYSKKTETQREQFMLYSSGNWKPLLAVHDFSVGYYATLQHFSESETEEGVVDNALVKPWVNYNQRIRRVNMDVSVAWLQSFQRDRLNDDNWATPGGFWADLGFNLGLRRHTFGVSNAIYLGDDIMPYWNRYGKVLYFGETFFRTTHGVYNRLEVSWSPRISNYVSLKIGSVHHYDGDTWNWQQTATLKININRQTLK